MNYIRDDLTSDTSVIVSNSNDFVELLILCIKSNTCLLLPCTKPMTVYRYAQYNLGRNIQVKFSNVIIGDFNFAIIKWHTQVIQRGRSVCQRQARATMYQRCHTGQ